MTIKGFQSAYEIPSFYVGVLPANIDLSALVTTSPTYQYAGVDVVAATGTGILEQAAVSTPASSGAVIIGVLQNNPQLGEAASVMVHGVTKAMIGANVTVGQILTVNAAGALVPAATGNYGCARALQAGANGNYIAVLLLPAGKQ